MISAGSFRTGTNTHAETDRTQDALEKLRLSVSDQLAAGGDTRAPGLVQAKGFADVAKSESLGFNGCFETFDRLGGTFFSKDKGFVMDGKEILAPASLAMASACSGVQCERSHGL